MQRVPSLRKPVRGKNDSTGIALVEVYNVP